MKSLTILTALLVTLVEASFAGAAGEGRMSSQEKEQLPQAVVVRVGADGAAEFVALSEEDTIRFKAEMEMEGQISERLQAQLAEKLAKNPAVVWTSTDNNLASSAPMDERDLIGGEKAWYFSFWWGTPSFYYGYYPYTYCGYYPSYYSYSWYYWYRW